MIKLLMYRIMEISMLSDMSYGRLQIKKDLNDFKLRSFYYDFLLRVFFSFSFF